MPEGPSIVLLKKQCKSFSKQKVLSVSGNTKINVQPAEGMTVERFRSWGKHFLICFKGFTIRIHFLLFGSYRINEEREMKPRLSLKFKNGTLNFYACSIKIIEGNLNDTYDWSTDVMNSKWNPAAAYKKVKASDAPVCDLLLDQQIFSGVGNIIKNEVLFRIRLHPLSTGCALSPVKRKLLVAEARNYSFDFLKWKAKFVLRKHWLAHTKKTCPRCGIPLHKEYLGKTQRRTFFCTSCQILYKRCT